MVEVKVNGVRKIIIFVILAMHVSSFNCFNVGLLAGDLKRLSPLVIKKYSQNSPVFINIKSEKQPLREFLHKLPTKPPPMKCSELKPKPKKFPRSIFNIPKLPLVPYLLPLIPRTPVLPMFPNWLPPPTSSPSLPMVPALVKLNNLVAWNFRNTKILGKLIELKSKGTLSNAEYIKFKNLLVK